MSNYTTPNPPQNLLLISKPLIANKNVTQVCMQPYKFLANLRISHCSETPFQVTSRLTRALVAPHSLLAREASKLTHGSTTIPGSPAPSFHRDDGASEEQYIAKTQYLKIGASQNLSASSYNTQIVCLTVLLHKRPDLGSSTTTPDLTTTKHCFFRTNNTNHNVRHKE